MVDQRVLEFPRLVRLGSELTVEHDRLTGTLGLTKNVEATARDLCCRNIGRCKGILANAEQNGFCRNCYRHSANHSSDLTGMPSSIDEVLASSAGT
jgi:hypothetical protein